MLCSKHFEQDCFIVEGVSYHEDMGIPVKKRVKSNVIPITFGRLTHGERGMDTHTHTNFPDKRYFKKSDEH